MGLRDLGPGDRRRRRNAAHAPDLDVGDRCGQRDARLILRRSLRRGPKGKSFGPEHQTTKPHTFASRLHHTVRDVQLRKA